MGWGSFCRFLYRFGIIQYLLLNQLLKYEYIYIYIYIYIKIQSSISYDTKKKTFLYFNLLGIIFSSTSFLSFAIPRVLKTIKLCIDCQICFVFMNWTFIRVFTEKKRGSQNSANFLLKGYYISALGHYFSLEKISALLQKGRNKRHCFTDHQKMCGRLKDVGHFLWA